MLQVQRANSPKPATGELIAIPVTATSYVPNLADLVTSLARSLPGEVTKEILEGVKRPDFTKFGAYTFDFLPSSLNAFYSIKSATIFFPTIKLTAHAPIPAEAKEEFTYKVELGWIVQILVDGVVEFSEVQGNPITVQGTIAEPFSNNFINGISRQIQIFNPLEIPPGKAFQVRIMPFFRILEIVKPNAQGNDKWDVTAFARGGEPPEQPATCNLFLDIVPIKRRQPSLVRG